MVFNKDLSLLVDDYIAFNMFHNKKRLIINSLIFILSFTFLAIVISSFRSYKYGYIFVIIGIITLGLMTFGNISSLKKLSKKQYDSSKAMQAPATVVVNNQKVSETNSFGSTIYEWNDLYQAVESKNAVYIYFSKLQAFVIPKRLLTQQEEATLRQLINENIDPKKNKLRKG